MTKPRQIVGDHVEAVPLLSSIFSVLQVSVHVTDRRHDFRVRKEEKMTSTPRYIRAIHTEPAGSNNHEHITQVRWNTLTDSTLNPDTKERVISWLNQGSENQAFVSAGSNLAVVKVVNPTPPRSPYLRTIKDGSWSDNLLSLPRF